MFIGQDILDGLTVKAKANPRLRQAYDLRNSAEDGSQRILNALEPGTVMPIHRHLKTSESIAIIRGRIAFRLYDDNGQPTAENILTPGGQFPMIHIEAGQWHSLEVLEEGSVVFESKDGRKFRPNSLNTYASDSRKCQ